MHTVGDEEVAEADVKDILTDVGFTHTMQTGPITSISGDWKMKLALARAMLRRNLCWKYRKEVNSMRIKIFFLLIFQ